MTCFPVHYIETYLLLVSSCLVFHWVDVQKRISSAPIRGLGYILVFDIVNNGTVNTLVHDFCVPLGDFYRLETRKWRVCASNIWLAAD